MPAKSKTPVEITNMRTPIVITSQVTIELPYPGGEISKNLMWRNGNRRNGLTPTAKAWQDTLTDWLLRYPFYHLSSHILLPVSIEVGARFTDGNHRSDIHNFTELIGDAVEAGIGVNDKDFEIATKQPTMGVEVPVVIIKLIIRFEV